MFQVCDWLVQLACGEHTSKSGHKNKNWFSLESIRVHVKIKLLNLGLGLVSISTKTIENFKGAKVQQAHGGSLQTYPIPMRDGTWRLK